MITKKGYKAASVLAVMAIVLSPVAAGAAVDTKSTTINATIGSTISMTTSATVAIGITPASSGAASSASDTVTVATNNATGYNLTLADTDATTTLVNGANTIAAHAGTFAAPSTLANNSWGFRVDSAGTFGAGPTIAQTNQANLSGTWAGVPATGSAVTLKTTGATTAGDATTVWYGVKADTTKPSGVYTDSVTYTATTNP
ncbi:MAG: exported protein of unknown function [Candidatus Saccharibacteria bacterium]|jgi:hypothetical protein|nr:exported protein of unknown function [Candidatus Saccharibacteria bacterium]